MTAKDATQRAANGWQPPPARARFAARMLPHFALIFAATFWGSAPATVKLLLTVFPLFDAAAIRFAMAAAVLWLAALLFGKLGRIRTVGWRPFVAGLLDPGVISLSVYYGLQLTTAIHASVIFALMPVVSTLFGRVFLKEPVAPAVLGGAAMALVGTGLLVTGRGTEGGGIWGDLIVVAAVVVICAIQLVMRGVARAHGEPIIATASMLSGATVTAVVARLILAPDQDFAYLDSASTEMWLLMIYAAAIVSAGGFFCYNYALRHLPVGRASLYGVLEGPAGVLLAWLMLGEFVNAQEAFGVGLAIVGASLPALIKLRRRPQPAPT